MVLLVAVSACQTPGQVGFDTIYYYGEYVPAGEGSPLDGEYIARSSSETSLSGPETRQDTLTSAISLLLDSGEPLPPRVNYWAGPCTPGRSLESVDVGDVQITVRLADPPPPRQDCQLTVMESEVRRQQMAWTVSVNLLDERPTSVITPDGQTWPLIVPDPEFLQP